MAPGVRGAVLAAVVACLGNALQGWDNAAIAGSVIYVKREFHLETKPTVEGLIMAMSLIGATSITTFSGVLSDKFGRCFMLRVSAFLYLLAGLVVLFAPNVYVLLVSRLLAGCAVGLAVTIAPLYVSETSPPEIRGQLNTLPQLGGSGFMFLCYCVVFAMSLHESPSWRLMLGMIVILALVYVGFSVFYLPESPRWLVSKGRMAEAKQVLQQLRGTEEISGELALLVEGLASEGEPTIEEYMMEPAPHEPFEASEDKDQSKFGVYAGGQRQGSWIAKTAAGQSSLGLASRQGSTLMPRSGSIVDPTVTLFGSLHEKMPAGEAGGMRSGIFSRMGSMLGAAEARPAEKDEHWDAEAGGLNSEHNQQTPLLTSQQSAIDKDLQATGYTLGVRRNSSLIPGNIGDESVTDIGGGWQLAYKYEDERKKEGLTRVFLQNKEGTIPTSRRGSFISVHEDADYAAPPKDTISPADIKPTKAATKGSTWHDLCEPGVRHALFVGMVLLMLQQFSGISGILYYTPQLLEQAGVGELLANTGLSSSSISILMSTFTMLVMIPCICIAMKLMDVAGRRTLLLKTIPVLIVVLILLILSKEINMGRILGAVISTVGVVVYMSFFVMGLGPIPSIFYAEIFPTKVRGTCMAICGLSYWIFNILVTYSLPLVLSSMGLVGVFGSYAIACSICWIFVYLKVPETKGMPLEVITEIFAAGSKK